jgi:nitroreductase
MRATTLPLSVPDAAKARRAIRAYTAEAVAPGDLDAILRETALAPSSNNLQPWRFVVVKDAAARQRLAGAAYNQKQVTAAPVVIVLYSDMADTLANLDRVTRPDAGPEKAAKFRASIERMFATRSEAEREAWGREQGFIALGFLLLAAAARGYATSPMGGYDEAAVKQLFELPAHVRVVALVAMGRGAEDGLPHHRHALESIVRTV